MQKHHHHNHQSDLLESDPICSSAGCTQYSHPNAGKGIPRDYFVPSFGKDKEMVATQKHWEDQEKIFGVWNLQNKTKIKQVYKV
jgi:hypothetical protein